MIEIKVNLNDGRNNQEYATDKLEINGQALYFKNSKGDATGMYVVPEGAYVSFMETE